MHFGGGLPFFVFGDHGVAALVGLAVAFDADEVWSEVLVPEGAVVSDDVLMLGVAVGDEVFGNLGDDGGCCGHWVPLVDFFVCFLFGIYHRCMMTDVERSDFV